MLLCRSVDPRHLSNAYAVGDEPGGAAVFVDSGAPLEPLLLFVDENRLTPTHVLRTHSHADHVEHEGMLGPPVMTSAGRLALRPPSAPGEHERVLSHPV